MSLDEDQRLKRLDHMQGIVQRLAGNSFLIKGWAITVASAMLGFAVKSQQAADLAYLALLPTLCFWLLDAYYLGAETRFREAYNTAAADPDTTLCGITANRVGFCRMIGAAFNGVTVLPYLVLAICEIVVGSGRYAAVLSSIRV